MICVGQSVLTTQGMGQIRSIAPPCVFVDIGERSVEFRLAQCVEDVADQETQQLLFRKGQIYVVEHLGQVGETINELHEHHIIYRRTPLSETHQFFQKHFRWVPDKRSS